MSIAIRSHTARRSVWRVERGQARRRNDQLTVEEPLEIRIVSGNGKAPKGGNAAAVAVTMRTPGHDFELAAGFLFTEGLVRRREDVRAIAYCGEPVAGAAVAKPRYPEERYNVVNVYLRDGVVADVERLRRHFYTTSSCGICGKASLEAVRLQGIEPVDDDVRVTVEVIGRLGDRLREAQALFARTGGLHGAALFDAAGQLHAVREDVGRHNAVDKVIGHALLEGRIPLTGTILMVSGRASFEIVQKAAAARVPVVAAVSAPSSLACDATAAFNMTLIGFLRGQRFNVYTGPERIVL